MNELGGQDLDISFDEAANFRAMNTEKKLTSLFNMNAEILFKIESINNNLNLFTKQLKRADIDHSQTFNTSALLQNLQSILSENERLKIHDLNNNKVTCFTEKSAPAVSQLTQENADLKSQLEICAADLKIERSIRKSLESRLANSVEEVEEYRTLLENNNRQIEEKKRKFDVDKLMLDLKRDAEIEEMSRLHAFEIHEMSEKLKKVKAKLSDNQQEDLSQLQYEINSEWQSRFDKSFIQLEQEYETKIVGLHKEKYDLEKVLADMNLNINSLKEKYSKIEVENIDLRTNMADLLLIKRKYEQLQSEVLIRKERFHNRIKELLEADPEPELIGEEVFNSLY